MSDDSKRTGWGWPILLGLLAGVVAYGISVLVVSGYAFGLAFRAKGAPDQGLIRQFATHWAPWITNIACLGLTGLFAWRLGKRRGALAPSSGVILGGASGLFILASALIFRHSVGPRGLIVAALLVVLGWLGARVGGSLQKDGQGL